MDRVSKDVMVAALVAAGVEVPDTASLSQIRSLYTSMTHTVDKSPGAAVEDGSTPSATSVMCTDVRSAASTSAIAVSTSGTSASTSAAAALTSGTAASTSGTSVTCVESPGATAISSVANTGSEVTDHEMDVELLRLRKQREILLLQREIAEYSHSTQERVGKIDVGLIECMVSKFTGDDNYDIRKWLDDLEDAFTALRFNDCAKLVGCRRLLDGTAKVFLRTVVASNYEDLKSSLLEEFRRHYTLQDVYHQLKSRRIKVNESLKRYVIEMQEIATQANIPEDELVDFIIEGLGDSSSAVSVLYGATTLKELKSLLDRYERKRAKISSSTMSKGNYAGRNNILSARSTVPAVVSQPSSSARRGTEIPTSSDAKLRCYNCSQFGHYQSECPRPRRPVGSCFRCGQLDHIHRDCPNRPGRVVALAEEVDGVINNVNSLQLVSVAFGPNVDKCIDILKLCALFDSGSPRSFISSKYVPAKLCGKLKPSLFFGLGRTQLMTYGRTFCLIEYLKNYVYHEFIILPENTMPVPLIVGRDLLYRMNIH